MKIVNVLLKNGKTLTLDIEEITNGDVSSDDIKEMTCPCCGEKAWIVHGGARRNDCGSAYHAPGCVNCKSSSKPHAVVIGTEVDTTKQILDRPDRDPNGPNPGGENGPEPGPQIGPLLREEDIDPMQKYVIRREHTLRGICKLIKQEGLDVQFKDGTIARNFFPTRKELFDFVKYKCEGIRIVPVKKYKEGFFSTTTPPERKPGYFYFADVYSSTTDTATFFAVKLKNLEQHNMFIRKCSSANRTPEEIQNTKNIILLGDWTLEESNNHPVYYAEINAYCYYFTRFREGDYDKQPGNA